MGGGRYNRTQSDVAYSWGPSRVSGMAKEAWGSEPGERSWNCLMLLYLCDLGLGFPHLSWRPSLCCAAPRMWHGPPEMQQVSPQ